MITLLGVNPYYCHSMFMMVTTLSPVQGVLYLSATGLAGMTAAALAFCYFNHIIAENQIQLSVKRHRYGHICEYILND